MTPDLDKQDSILKTMSIISKDRQLLKDTKLFSKELSCYFKHSDFEDEREYNLYRNWAFYLILDLTYKLNTSKQPKQVLDQSPIIKALLRKRGENFMEQAIETTKDLKDYEKIIVKMKALELERKAKLALVNQANKTSWMNVTLDEMRFDIDSMYLTAMKNITDNIETNEGRIDRDTLALINLVRQLKTDKENNEKFSIMLDQKLQTTPKKETVIRLDDTEPACSADKVQEDCSKSNENEHDNERLD